MLVFSSIFAIYSTTVTVLLENSSDLGVGQRPTFKLNEFAGGGPKEFNIEIKRGVSRIVVLGSALCGGAGLVFIKHTFRQFLMFLSSSMQSRHVHS